ncbi:MAG: hypothetical protein MUD17_05920 [Gemmatimonadaceae bacterium]|jgi:hypothetical protein|nr:hypothetical protein [Gemmatimonadaceae bacterium]
MTVALLAACVGFPNSASAQPDRREELEKIMERAYNAPDSEQQLRECKYTALSRNLRLDQRQATQIRDAILIERPYEPRPRLNWEQARTMMRSRDSALLLAMRTARDSARMQRNIEGESQWWSSGACNGKPIPRQPPRP